MVGTNQPIKYLWSTKWYQPCLWLFFFKMLRFNFFILKFMAAGETEVQWGAIPNCFAEVSALPALPHEHSYALEG